MKLGMGVGRSGRAIHSLPGLLESERGSHCTCRLGLLQAEPIRMEKLSLRIV